MSRLRIPIIAALVVVVAAVAVLVLVKSGKLGNRNHGGISTVHITASDGVPLAADVLSPSGSGKHPLVVMPTSWGAEQSQYQNVGRLLLEDGFVVVAYKQRGFDHLGGQVDFAGPQTLADARTVINWALAHTPSDPTRVGMLGDSYGAGVALLTAEHDPRVKVVVALSTWTDWGYSFAPNSTVATASLTTLFQVAQAKGVLGPDMKKLEALYKTDPAAALELIKSLSPSRSPMTDVAALNKNHTAVMLANGMQDSIFGPQQLVNFYDKLTGPKRLQLAVGDHTQPEVTGFLTGRHVGPVGDGVDWLTHYLTGQANGINTKQPIELTDAATNQVHGLSAWPSSSALVSQALALPEGSTNASGAGDAWATDITTGTDSTAASPALTTNLTAPYRFGTANLKGLRPQSSLQWASPAVAARVTVLGTSRLHLDIASSASKATFFVYLYDVLPSGEGALMSVTPETVDGLGGTTSKSVTLDLAPISWTVRAGDHISLVVDTVDSRWSTQSAAGSTFTVSSAQADPATLSVPTTS